MTRLPKLRLSLLPPVLAVLLGGCSGAGGGLGYPVDPYGYPPPPGYGWPGGYYPPPPGWGHPPHLHPPPHRPPATRPPPALIQPVPKPMPRAR